MSEREETIKELSKLFKESSVGIKHSSVGWEVSGDESTVDLRKEDALPVLLALLKVENKRVRLRAAWMLGLLGEKATKAVPELLKLMKENDFELRLRATSALGEIKAAEAVPELIKAMREDAEESVRQRAAKSLGKIAKKLGKNRKELIRAFEEELQ